ncbi:hypothetical protein AX769_06360 [Frondihabitans sp. PAMC 28766]|nr:hypothetical protein AX769_06360 [Frondihabitans sp. PAMC 28766]
MPRGRLGIAVVLLLAAAITLVFPSSASALTSTGHGVGHLWAGDNVSWLGSYRLDDGRLAFCLEAGKSSPVGNDYDLTTGSTALGLSKTDIAKLAYIARHWSPTRDSNTAAAAQLAVWSITGLNGHTQSYYAGRANDQRAVVLARANEMLSEAAARATVSAKASVTISLDSTGAGTVRADVTSTLAAGASRPCPPEQSSGRSPWPGRLSTGAAPPLS